jgi:MFS family permease
LFSDYRGIPWEARFLIYLSIIPNFAIGFIYTDLSYFLPEIQGIGPGIPISVIGVTLVALMIPFGILSDRHGRLKMLVLGNVCASLSLVGFALTSNFGLVLIIAILEGTGEAAYAVSFVALVAEKAGNEKRTAAFSLVSFLGWVAGALGSFAISSVIPLQGVGFDARQAHIILYTIVGLLNLSITPFIFRIKDSPTYSERKQILPHKSGGVLVRFSTYSVIIQAGAGLFINLMAWWFRAAYGVTDAQSGPALGITSMLTAFIVVVSPRLARRLGLVKAVVITQAASTIFMVAVPSSPTFTVAASIYLVRTFLSNLSNPLIQSLVMGLVSPDERGTAAGVSASLWRLPNALSTSIGSSLIAARLLSAPFYIAAMLYVVAISSFWFMFRNAKLPEETEGIPQATIQSSSLEGPKVER